MTLNKEALEAAKTAAEKSWQSSDMSWETALSKGITAYLAASTPAKTGELVGTVVGFMHPTAGWCHEKYSEISMHCQIGGPAPIALIKQSEAAVALTTLAAERDALRKLAGLGCDAREGGAHNVVKQGAYAFCSDCGETLTQVDLRERCRLAEAALTDSQAEVASLREELREARMQVIASDGQAQEAFEGQGILRAALEPFAEYMKDGGDLDNKGQPLPDDQGVGWIYLTNADFRRARAAIEAGRVK